MEALVAAQNWDRHQPQSEGLQLCENYDAFIVTGQPNQNTCNREGILMSIGFSGLDTPCCVQPVTIDVPPTHPLIQLAQVIPWQALADMVLPESEVHHGQGEMVARQTTHVAYPPRGFPPPVALQPHRSTG